MHRGFLLSAVLGLMTSGLSAQQLPDEASLERILAGSLPPWWSASGLVVVATTQLGDASRPQALIRFEVDAAPAAPLFEETSSEGPFALVVQTRPAEETRRLYGFFDLSYSAGSWTGAATIENPVAGLGQPLDLFGRPTLDISSPDAEATLTALRSTATAETTAALERDLAVLRAQHASSLTGLEIAHSTRLGELRAAQATELAALEERHSVALAEAERGQRTALASITAEIAPLLAEAEAERERLLGEAANATAQALRAAREAAELELAELQTAHAEARSAVLARQAAEMAELQASDGERARQLTEAQRATAEALRAAQEEGDAELEALRAAHAQRRGELITRQRQELAEVETGLATERVSLQRQLEAATDVLALQQSLQTALAARDRASAEMMAALERAIEARRAIVARLPENWGGEITCVESGGQGRSWSNKWYMRLRDRRPDGFQASIAEIDLSRGSAGKIAEFVLKDEAATFPLELTGHFGPRDLMPWSNIRLVTIQIAANGRLTGQGEASWTDNNVQIRANCNIVASSSS